MKATARPLAAGLAAGAIGGLALVLQLNARAVTTSLMPGDFARLLAAGRWSEPAIVAGVVVIGMASGVLYMWCEPALPGPVALKGLLFGLVVWLVQSLYMTGQPLPFLLRLPAAALAAVTAISLVWNVVGGLLLAFWYARLRGPATGRELSPVSAATSNDAWLPGVIVATGLAAGLLGEAAWRLLFAVPDAIWGPSLLRASGAGGIFAALVSSGATGSLLQGESALARTLLAIPLALSYAIVRGGLGGSPVGRGLKFGALIYVLRYVWREWTGDVSLLHQPLELTPFFLTTELLVGLTQGLAVAWVFELLAARMSRAPQVARAG